MHDEDHFLPLSGLQHMVFCDRQAALIHVQGIWVENALTIEGGHLHRVVDEGGSERRDRIRVHRGLRLVSRNLGLSGRADVVEFHRCDRKVPGALKLDGEPYWWQPLPVEFKRGEPKAHRADEVQLCAQAICLEEEFAMPIAHGSLFYGRRRRRIDVAFDRDLRSLTHETAARFHELVRAGETPLRYREAKCRRCSLYGECLPPKSRAPTSARDHTRRLIEAEIRRKV